MDDEPTNIHEAAEEIERLKDQYQVEAKRLKLAYLQEVCEARAKFGTSAVADALGVSRHRVYQIEREHENLVRELAELDAAA